MEIATRAEPLPIGPAGWSVDPDVDEEAVIVSVWHAGERWIRGFTLSSAWKEGEAAPEAWELTVHVFPRPAEDPVWLARALTVLVLLFAGSAGLLTTWALAGMMGGKARAVGLMVFFALFLALTVGAAVATSRLRPRPEVPPPDVIDAWARQVRAAIEADHRLR